MPSANEPSSVAAAPPPLRIPILVYPKLTLLDMAGPQAALGMHGETYLAWKTRDPVVSDSGVTVLPTHTFDAAIDFGPTLLPRLRGETVAKLAQPALENDPAPILVSSGGQTSSGERMADGASDVDRVRNEGWQRLRIAILLEGATLITLVLIASPLKRLADLPVATQVLGPVHGLAFLFFLYVLVEARAARMFGNAGTLRLLIGAMVPFGGIVNERWLARARRSNEVIS